MVYDEMTVEEYAEFYYGLYPARRPAGEVQVCPVTVSVRLIERPSSGKKV